MTNTHARRGHRIGYPQRKAAMAAMYALHRAVAEGPLEQPLRRLVEIRASQLNGCAFCLDMHHHDAREEGESQQRLDVVGAWHEVPHLFTDRERAALALTEAVTLLAGRGVPDEAIRQAEAVFDADELADLLFAIAEINAWNRLAVTGRAPVPQRA